MEFYEAKDFAKYTTKSREEKKSGVDTFRCNVLSAYARALRERVTLSLEGGGKFSECSELLVTRYQYPVTLRTLEIRGKGC